MKIQHLIFAIPLLLLLGCSKNNAVQPLEADSLKSSEKQMLDFRFTGIEKDGITVDIPAIIDESNKAITAEMPSGMDVSAIEPEVEISHKAIYEPKGPQDFSKPIHYTVTAEDGTSNTYLVSVGIALSQKEILLKIAEANPGKLDWKEEDNLGDWREVTINGDGQIIEINMYLKGLTILPSEIGQLTSLQKLYLRRNDLSTLPSEIGQLIDLQRLEIDGNDLETLPPEIGQLSNLQFLGLPYNNLVELPTEIGQLSSLQELDLSYNQLANLPSGIGGLSNLEHLDLDFNKLSTLPPEIGKLQSLRSLELYTNILSTIPSEIGQLVNLEVLVINDNNLIEIPPHIGQLDNLKKLKLQNNNLNIDDILPLFRDQLSTSCKSGLEELQLIGNEGLKTLPGCICELDLLYGGTTDIDIVEEVNSWADCKFVGTGRR